MLERSRLPVVNFLASAPCLGDGTLSLERYAYGHFSEENETIAGIPFSIRPAPVTGGVHASLTMFGYFVDAGKQLPEDRQGLVVRVKNMGVELNTLFESKDQAANTRITGELFIEHLDEQHAITINRNELVKEHPDYTAIRDSIEPLMKLFIDEVRGRVDVNSKVKKQVDRIKGMQNAVKTVGEALGEVGWVESESCQDSGVLKECANVDLIAEIREVDDAIIVYQAAALEKAFEVRHNDDEVEVTLNEGLLDTLIYVNGNEYTYHLKNGAISDPPCEVLTRDRVIYVNLNHPILKSRSEQIIRAVVALRFAYLAAQGDADRLYRLTLDILSEALK